MQFKHLFLIAFLFIIMDCKVEAKEYSPDIWGMWQVNKCKSVRTYVLLDQVVVNTLVMKGSKCAIQSGDFLDPYTGKTIPYKDGLDIDHIVPRKWAWDRGASRWQQHTRYAFANDLVNLVAVDDSTNRSKGDKPPSKWLPPNTEFHCEYIYRFDGVVKKYKLKYDPQESIFIKNTLSNKCKGYKYVIPITNKF